MYDFMFTDYRGDELYQFDAERRRRARERGTIFDADELAAILALWAGAGQGEPVHSIDRLRLPLTGGGHVEITPNRIQIEQDEASPEALRAAMKHIAANWQGRAVITLDEHMSREERLRMRAYAEVYGVELHDVNDSFLPLALTPAELARLPELRQKVRDTHQDAPPGRQDEAQEHAARNARRRSYPMPEAA
jgi:hypothetical protein